MGTTKNTSYRVHAHQTTDTERLAFNVEEGAMVTTESGIWQVYNGAWRKIYPQGGLGSGIGWCRYDDGLYTSINKLALLENTKTVLTNNGASIYRSYDGIDYYNPATSKVLADNLNDVYVVTVVFKCQAANANQTFLRLQLDATNGTPYERVGVDIPFPKGNDVAHEFHQVFQYYADQNFVDNGSTWEITATGGTASVWDIIFFIQKTQSFA